GTASPVGPAGTGRPRPIRGAATRRTHPRRSPLVRTRHPVHPPATRRRIPHSPAEPLAHPAEDDPTRAATGRPTDRARNPALAHWPRQNRGRPAMGGPTNRRPYTRWVWPTTRVLGLAVPGLDQRHGPPAGRPFRRPRLRGCGALTRRLLLP